ncbi:MAG: DUF2796 domain-containing protein [Desulfovibrio sp.]|jgi:hypothetical protein|nr:DUF2796 domain-containing protein [Desulfovibrio sp.]
MKKFCSFFIVLGGFFVFGVQTFANEAHVHGVTNMNVTVEGGKVEIELKSPLANFISFEHEPETDAQKKEVRAMGETLRKADSLFLFPVEAGCKLEEVSLESGVIDDHLLNADASGHAPKTHGRHEGRGHADHGHSGKDEHGHADIEVEVSFMCRNPEKLTKLQVNMFSAFPSLHEIEVQMLTPAEQKAAELTPEANTITW